MTLSKFLKKWGISLLKNYKIKLLIIEVHRIINSRMNSGKMFE